MRPLFKDVLAQADHEMRLPSSALKILDLSSKDSTEARDLANAIEIDPIFSAYLLRLVNSSAYSRGASVTDVERAVKVLGFTEVGLLAVVLASSKNLPKIETDLLSSTNFWDHSLTTALLARSTLRKLRITDHGILSAALLHDFALPIQISLCTEEMQKALDISMYSDDVSLASAERQQLGFDHTELGAALFTEWQLPDIIIDTARYHHTPARSTQYREEIAVTAWANTIQHIGTDADEEDYVEIDELLKEIAGIVPLFRPEDDSLLIEAQAEAADMIALF